MKSVDFFEMTFLTHSGRKQTGYGAVAFNLDLSSSKQSVIEKVFLPHPDLELLIASLKSSFNDFKKKSFLKINGLQRKDVTRAILGYCLSGSPLPQLISSFDTELEGVTPFQKEVYKEVCTIPHGEVRSYSWIAKRLGRSQGLRAVGGALSRNPFPLIIPCHRVLKKDGNLGGFMGEEDSSCWQLILKKTFIELEEHHIQPSLFL